MLSSFHNARMMARIATSIIFTTFFAYGLPWADAQNATAMPVVLEKTVDAAHTQNGAPVFARTMQVVHLANGTVIPRGAMLEGKVVEASAFHFDSTPYAQQKESILSIRFDRVVVSGSSLPLSAQLRAVASPIDVEEARTPQYRDDPDSVGTRVLIGGEEISGMEKKIRRNDGSVVGYERRDGDYARLLSSTSLSAAQKTLYCEASQTEQSIAVFSADACGVYDLSDLNIVNAGASSGTIVLSSERGSVRFPRGSAALLMVSLK